MDELVNFLVQKYGKASSPTGIKGYSLDNEPALWPTTHPLLHPAKPTIKEMMDKSIALSTAVKNVDSTAEIFGPVTYGFAENYHFQDATDWSQYSQYNTYINAYLANMKPASDSANKRLLDVLDTHWYPEVQGTTIAGGKVRITEDNADPGVAYARMQAPRSLWDPTYQEDSWIGQWFASTAFPLLPKLQSSIDRYYPGTKMAFTEFDYGGKNHISGGIAAADVLGIFGKYGVYFSSRWGDMTGYISTAYKLYRNYDGVKSTFGDTEIDATNPDSDNISIYASDE
jgi:mannan endo-1,4-beta-mannosidase